MAWAVYTYVAIILFCLGTNLANHGKKTTINFWNVLITQLILMFLLYKGGFFDVL